MQDDGHIGRRGGAQAKSGGLGGRGDATHGGQGANVKRIPYWKRRAETDSLARPAEPRASRERYSAYLERHARRGLRLQARPRRGTIHAEARDRSRRCGDGVSRARRAARAVRRDQGAARRAVARDRRGSASSARSSSRRACSIRTSCRSTIRARRTDQLYYVMPYVEGDSLRQRLTARQPALDRGGGADRARGGGRAGVRARARRRAPRHQAGEHPLLRRSRRGGGLRHRARDRPREREDHAAGDDHRHAGVHEPRAGARPRVRRAERRLLAGLRAVRGDGRRAPPFPGDTPQEQLSGAARARCRRR